MRRLCYFLLLLLTLSSQAWAAPVATSHVEDSLEILPYMAWYPTHDGKTDYLSASSAENAGKYLSLKNGFSARDTGPGWLRLKLVKDSKLLEASKEQEKLYLNISSLPSGKATLFSPSENNQSPWFTTIKSYQSIHLNEPSLTGDTYYIHLEETPGLWFNPSLDRGENKAPVLPPDLILPGLLLACFAVCILRAIKDRALWPLWAAALLAFGLVGALAPLPLSIRFPHYTDLPAMLAPGMMLIIFPHLGRLILRTRDYTLGWDTCLRTLSLIGVVASLAPLLPGYAWITRLYPLWGLCLLPIIPIAGSAMTQKRTGAFTYFSAIFMPFIGSFLSLLALSYPEMHPMASNGSLWGLAVGGIALSFTRVSSGEKDKEEEETDDLELKLQKVEEKISEEDKDDLTEFSMDFGQGLFEQFEKQEDAVADENLAKDLAPQEEKEEEPLELDSDSIVKDVEKDEDLPPREDDDSIPSLDELVVDKDQSLADTLELPEEREKAKIVAKDRVDSSAKDKYVAKSFEDFVQEEDPDYSKGESKVKSFGPSSIGELIDQTNGFEAETHDPSPSEETDEELERDERSDLSPEIQPDSYLDENISDDEEKVLAEADAAFIASRKDKIDEDKDLKADVLDESSTSDTDINLLEKSDELGYPQDEAGIAFIGSEDDLSADDQEILSEVEEKVDRAMALASRDSATDTPPKLISLGADTSPMPFDPLDELGKPLIPKSSLAAGESFIFNLHYLIREVHDVVTPMAQDNGILLSWFVAPTLPSLLMGDVPHLRQSLTLLLQNSIKATANGSVQLYVKENTQGKEGKANILFNVVDSGSTKRTDTGFFQAWELAERTGGEFSIDYVSDEGTSVSFSVIFDLPGEDMVKQYKDDAESQGIKIEDTTKTLGEESENTDQSSIEAVDFIKETSPVELPKVQSHDSYTQPDTDLNSGSLNDIDSAINAMRQDSPEAGIAQFEAQELEMENAPSDEEKPEASIIITEMTTSNKKLLTNYFGSIDLVCHDAPRMEASLDLFKKYRSNLIVYDADSLEDSIIKSIEDIKSESYPDEKISFLILASIESQANRLLEHGATHSLLKPFDKKQLIDKAREAAPSIFPQELKSKAEIKAEKVTPKPLASEKKLSSPSASLNNMLSGNEAEEALDIDYDKEWFEHEALYSDKKYHDPHKLDMTETNNEAKADKNQKEPLAKDKAKPDQEERKATSPLRKDLRPESSKVDKPLIRPATAFGLSSPAKTSPKKDTPKISSTSLHSLKDRASQAKTTKTDPIDEKNKGETAKPLDNAKQAGKSGTENLDKEKISTPEKKDSLLDYIVPEKELETKGLDEDNKDLERTDLSGDETGESAEKKISPLGSSLDKRAGDQGLENDDSPDNLPDEDLLDETILDNNLEIDNGTGTTSLPGLENESIDTVMLPLIPGLMHTIEDSLKDAIQGREEQQLLFIQEAVNSLAARAEAFGLEKLQKLAQCVERAANANDFEAVNNLLADLINVGERYNASLKQAYDDFIDGSRS